MLQFVLLFAKKLGQKLDGTVDLEVIANLSNTVDLFIRCFMR